MTRPRVVFELGGAGRKDLAHGGAFVRGVDLPELAECELVVTCGGREMSLDARVVMVGSGGVGLELMGFGPALRERLARFAEQSVAPPPEATPPPVDAEAGAYDTYEQTYDEPLDAHTDAAADAPDEPAGEPAAPVADDLPAGDVAADPAGMDELLELSPFEPEPVSFRRTGDFEAEEVMSLELETDAPAGQPTAAPPADAESPAEEQPADESHERALKGIPLNVHERVRGLNLQQQIKLALHGEISERMILERIYGKTVWEHLLRNPRITGPEVARIARMGQLPRPQIETICNNGGWLQIPEVRRALLSNPRLGTDQIIRVLRLLPKHEIKLAMVQSAYPMAVREQARRMVRAEP